jgi:hypothetical protein
LAKVIAPLLPPTGKRFIEAFAGRANLFFRVAQTLSYDEFWLNDIATYPFLLGLYAYEARDAMGRGRVPERNGRAAHDRMRNFSFEAFLHVHSRYNPVRKQALKSLWEQRPDLHE